ncbi:MAG TPA: hypothetical protein VK191_12950 [Symbiobacteriaceae bacterium]|nr:hypothetical protein [Symbiobacteriaceae bacterium]
MKLRVKRPSPGLVALAALLIAFAGGSLIRTGFGIDGPHPVQRLLAENEPEEHIRAVTLSADELILATEKGLIAQSGRRWFRVASAQGAFYTAAPLGQRLFLGGPQGLFAWDTKLTKLSDQSPGLLAAGAGRIVGLTPGALVESTDGSQWTQLSEPPAGSYFSLAVHPTDKSQVYLGGRDVVLYSMDGGRTWQRSDGLTGDVSAILPDPKTPDLVYALAGGRLWYSLTGGTTWLRSVQRNSDQIFVHLALSSDPKSGLVGVTSDGLVVEQLNEPK